MSTPQETLEPNDETQSAPTSPLPPGVPESSTTGEKKWTSLARFANDFAPADNPHTLVQAVDALLKRPAQLVHAIIHGTHAIRTSCMLVIVTALCLFGYGIVMGTFTGGEQLFAAPIKMSLGMFLSALICLPSLYIFTCLAGGNQSAGHVASFLLLSMALSALLLIGFAPVAWIFSQATGSTSFMGCLHLIFWMVGTVLGIRLLSTTLAFLNERHSRLIPIWACIFVVVALQMSTTLRPIVGKPHDTWIQGKKFFVVYWFEEIVEVKANRVR